MTISSQTLLDGPRNAIMKFTAIAESSDETAVTKVDASALSGSPVEVRIEKMQALTEGVSIDVLWDATADVLAFHIPSGTDETMTFDQPLVNDSGAGKTGDIKFTTVGLGAADRYTVLLYLRKVF